MHVPRMIRSRRALAAIAALAIVGVAAFLVAPDTIIRGLPFLLVLACPLMMVFMMRPMHQMPAAGSPRRDGDPYAREALARRLAELEAERAAITELLAAPPTGHPAAPIYQGGVSEATGRNVSSAT